jgi:hypothetical protein
VFYVTLRVLPFALCGGLGCLVTAFVLTVLLFWVACVMVAALDVSDGPGVRLDACGGWGVRVISTSSSSSSSLDPLSVVWMGAVDLRFSLWDSCLCFHLQIVALCLWM